MTPQLKAMRTEARKRYRDGFELSESELRRLHELLVQQIRRTAIGDNFITRYQIKYRNGSVAEPQSLDDVLAQENLGSAGIVRLLVEVSDTAVLTTVEDRDPKNLIGVQFCNVTEEEVSDFRSITSVVIGEDRDWVFVTSSQLEERIGKIKLWSLDSLAFSEFLSSGPVFVVVFAFLILLTLSVHSHRYSVQLDTLEQDWKAGTLKDPVGAMIGLAKANNSRLALSGSDIFLYVIAGIGLPLAWAIISLGLPYFRPKYNFLWGDYVAVYEKRRSIGRFILVTVVLGLVLAVLGSIISKKIGF